VETAAVLGFAVWIQVVAGNGVLPLLVEPVAVVAVVAVRAEGDDHRRGGPVPVVLAYQARAYYTFGHRIGGTSPSPHHRPASPAGPRTILSR
jgi:hypothetical protein